MTNPVQYTSNSQIREGDELMFTVMNRIELQDKKEYFILQDPFLTKHFIECQMYDSFGIRIGDKFPCRVVKINCTGRVILEPVHPLYCEGSSYTFLLVDSNEFVGKYFLKVEDIFKNCIELEVSSDCFPELSRQESVRCKVLEIKKGIPKLELITTI